ncbi:MULTISPECIES: hypothetical protein [Calothrix]|uniref:hypothetical protein n=1 Tax=Calothrix TaxID=1186 RepID=UPI001F54E34F|nr:MULTISPECIES: hypothetical protein [Calothrix]
MPPIQESGLIKIDGFYRIWNAGDTPDKYLTLGDIETVLKPQLFSLSNIANIINYPDENTVTFDSFPLVGQQTLQHLAQIVPNLSATNTATIKPVAALLKATYPQININSSLATLLFQNPTLGSLKLNQINLSSYKISDIPNLDTVQLSNFTLWQNALIKDIPRLNAVPLAYFPVPIAEVGNAIARIDFIWGTDEKRRQRTVSGSDVAGFSVPCSGQKCPYIELDDLEDSGRTIRGEFEGRSWISGKYQQVAGGWGCLKSVNAGKEPTGRLPYGSAFKVVVMEPNGQKEFIIKNKSISDSKEGRTVTWTDNLQAMPILTADEIMRFPIGKCAITNPGYTSRSEGSIPYALTIPIPKLDMHRMSKSEKLWDEQVYPRLIARSAVGGSASLSPQVDINHLEEVIDLRKQIAEQLLATGESKSTNPQKKEAEIELVSPNSDS